MQSARLKRDCGGGAAAAGRGAAAVAVAAAAIRNVVDGVRVVADEEMMVWADRSDPMSTGLLDGGRI